MMKLTGETMIFKNEKGFYSTAISNKKADGSYENMYISVNFKKGIEVPDKTRITIQNGFLSFYKTNEGLPKIKLVVLEFTTDDIPDVVQDVPQATDDELPF